MRGLRVGSFVLTEPLATGGMGAIWRGMHASGVHVAIKIIPTEAEEALYEATAGLQAEIRAVGALDHPNIVRVYDAGVLGPEHQRASNGGLRDGSPWLAMELADGSVRDLLRALDWTKLASLLLQVLDGPVTDATGEEHSGILVISPGAFGHSTGERVACGGAGAAVERYSY